jgi:hypothetical protein
MAMPRPAEHVRRAYDHRVADAFRDVPCLVARDRGAAGRLRHAKIPQQLREPLAIFSQVNRVGRRAQNLDARFLEIERQLQRRLAAKLDDA